MMWLLLPWTSYAQQAGSVDPSFGASLGLAGHVQQISLQSDGKLLVTGSFKRGLVRLNTDGSLDTTFDPQLGGIRGSGYALAVQSDGKIILGGSSYLTVGSVAHLGLARLDPDGSLDTSFNADALGNTTVSTLSVQTDGKILVGGSADLNGVVSNGLFRLNANGSQDTGFHPAIDAAASLSAVVPLPGGKLIVCTYITDSKGFSISHVYRLNADGSLDTGFQVGVEIDNVIPAVALQSDGKLLIGAGVHTGLGGTGFGPARLNKDGSLDTSFDSGPGSDITADAIAVQPDGKVLVGGFVSFDDDTTISVIARLNANGSQDTTFEPGQATFAFGVETIALQSNGKIIVGGEFASFDGMASSGLARLTKNGGLDSSYQVDVAPGLNGAVNVSVVQPDGKIIIGGRFTSFGNVLRKGVARLNPDGSLDLSFDPGTGADTFPIVNAVALQPDGKIIIGGSFTTFNGATRDGIARLNPDGSLDATFQPDVLPFELDNFVNAVALQSDGKIIIGRLNVQYGNKSLPGVARLNPDGSTDAKFDLGAGARMGVQVLTVQGDDKILVAGTITVNGVKHAGVFRLDADGGLDPTYFLGTGIGRSDFNSVDTVVVQPDSKILVGGEFKAYNGVVGSRLARLQPDGTADASFAVGTGTDSSVNEIAVQPDGKIVIGGGFSSFNGTPCQGLARLNIDGSFDASFDPGSGVNDELDALTVQPDGKIILGGSFNEVNGVVRNYVARLAANGSVDTGFTSGEDTTGIEALALQSTDGKVIVGGNFASVGGASANALVRLNTDGSLDPAFAPDLATGDTVQAVALQPDDGDVLAAAMVSDDTTTMAATRPERPHAQSKIKNAIVRCHKPNGQIDPAFSATTDGVTLALLCLPGRLAVIGGGFANVDGQPHTDLARLRADGTLDTGFVGVADGTVRALSLQPGGSGAVFVGGDFANVDGVARSHIARINADGSLGAGFDPGAGPNGTVNAVKALANGQVLIGGSFTSVDGVARGGLARLNADGNLDLSFAPAQATVGVRRGGRPTRQDAPSAPAAVMGLDVQDDGKIIVGGLFDQLGDATRHNVARLNTDGSVDASFDPGAGPDAAVNALQLQPDGRTLLGGNFASVGGLERRGAARLLGDSATVSIVARTGRITAARGRSVKFVVTRTGGTLVDALTVGYKIAGSAKAGVNYKPLDGSVTIPAGQTAATIKAKLLDASSPNTLTLKLKDGKGYTRATTSAKAKVVLLPSP